MGDIFSCCYATPDSTPTRQLLGPGDLPPPYPSPSPSLTPALLRHLTLGEEAQLRLAQRLALIQALPAGVFDGSNTERKRMECVICMSEFQLGDPIRILPCMHFYHIPCIDPWLGRSFVCPSCLAPVDTALLSAISFQDNPPDQRNVDTISAHSNNDALLPIPVPVPVPMPPGEIKAGDDGDDYYLLDEASAKDLSFVPLPRPKGPISRHFRTELVWSNILSIGAIHLIALYAISVAPSAQLGTWLMYMWLYFVTGLGVTAGAHRMWTHKSYKAHWTYRATLALVNTAAFQNHIIEWSRDHRTHHKFSETDADPHNAQRGFFFAHCGWLMCRKHPEVIRKGRLIDISDLERDPVLAFQRRFYFPLVLVFAFLVPTLLNSWLTGETLLLSFLIPGVLRYVMTLHITWLVNSAAHMWGAHPYDTTIHPAENMLVSLGAIGEGFHNYHHCFPWDYSTSEYGPLFNGTTCFIDIAAALGLVWGRKKASPALIKARRARTGDRS